MLPFSDVKMPPQAKRNMKKTCYKINYVAEEDSMKRRAVNGRSNN